MKKKILIGILVLLIVVQFIQPDLNKGSASSAQDVTHVVNVPDSVMSLLKTACYDCHSDNTRYPWYSKITPLNWWLKDHVDDGKKELNFSQFNKGTFKRKEHKMEEVAETVEKFEMPLKSYLWIHSEAKLNDAERKLLIDWATASRKQIMQDSMMAVVQ
ncbi:MAG TPA: heme-binding domain-containing protein [Flavisolibacter sp.]|nr:heme-binding domain-containing protein [Flavisolibacter sp.]